MSEPDEDREAFTRGFDFLVPYRHREGHARLLGLDSPGFVGLRMAREIFYLTQKQVAEMAGVSRKTITRWEAGATEVGHDQILTITCVFEEVAFDVLNVVHLEREFSNACKGLGSSSAADDIQEDGDAKFIWFENTIRFLVRALVESSAMARPADNWAQLFRFPVSRLEGLPLARHGMTANRLVNWQGLPLEEAQMTLDDVGVAMEASGKGMGVTAFVEWLGGSVEGALLLGRHRMMHEITIAFERLPITLDNIVELLNERIREAKQDKAT